MRVKKTNKPRVAIGGILHETNTFARTRTQYRDFQKGRALGVGKGAAILKLRHTNIGIGGFVNEAERRGFDLVPLIWTFAQPGGTVKHSAYVRLRRQFLSGLKAALPVDGVFLDLHGAMVTTRCEDAEGDFLQRVRKMAGPRTPIIAVLDLHANITPLMAAEADILIGYDTYPHVDIGERGKEAARLMDAMIRNTIRPTAAFRQLPLLIAPPRQCTLIPPMRDVFRMVHEMEKRPDVLSITFSGGFAMTDIRDAGASVVVTTNNNPALAGKLADKLAAAIWKRRKEFQVTLTPLKDAIAYALKTGEALRGKPRKNLLRRRGSGYAGQVFAKPCEARNAIQPCDNQPLANYGSQGPQIFMAKKGKGPVVLADGSDNPGGGAPCDGTVMLKALVEANVPSATVAVIADPEAVAAARKAGAGKKATITLGGKTDNLHGAPLNLTGLVRWVGNKSYFNKGPMMTGMRVDMGWTAVFVVKNVEIILTEYRFQPFDPEVFRCVGIEPLDRLLIGLKSSVHYRAAYQDLAAKIFEIDTPGVVTPDLTRYRFRRIRRPLYPLDDMK